MDPRWTRDGMRLCRWRAPGRGGARKHVYAAGRHRGRRRKASFSAEEIVTRAIVTAAPRPWSFSASSAPSGGGGTKTDCPIQTTLGRRIYGWGDASGMSFRPDRKSVV